MEEKGFISFAMKYMKLVNILAFCCWYFKLLDVF